MKRFVAFDVETTGFSPKNDRLIEIAAVTFDESGIVGSFQTLIDPEVAIRNSHVHGITSADVREAPRFFEIVPHLHEVLDGAVLVAHNRQFDIGFLGSEFDRAGVDYEDLGAICTLELLKLSSFRGSRRLADACTELGLEVLDAHQALNDALMTASLASLLLEKTRPSLDLTPARLTIPDHLQNCSPRLIIRNSSVGPATDEGVFLKDLLKRLPTSFADGDTRAAVVSEYINLLEMAISDRHLSHDEAKSLYDFADSHGLSLRDIQHIHLTFFRDLCQIALLDRYLSRSEKSDLQHVAALLSITDWEDVLSSLATRSDTITPWQGGIPARALSGETEVLDSEFARTESQIDFDDPSNTSRLLGKSIVVSGTFSEFSRDQAEKAIVSRGGKAPSSVSKKTFALVVGQEAGPSKLEKAAEFKIPILDVHGFRRLLDSGEI